MPASRTKNRTIKLTVVGAQQVIPAGMRGEGKDCLKPKAGKGKKSQIGNGKYFYVASPATGQATLVQQGKDATGASTVVQWKSSKAADAPRLSGAKIITEVQAQKALDAMNNVVVKQARKALSVPPILKGTWRGYIECTATGPHVVLWRDLAYARLAITSDLTPGKGATWEWAIVMNPRGTQRWFATTKKAFSGKGKKTFRSAFEAAMKQIVLLVGEACTVKTLTTTRAVKTLVRGKPIKGSKRTKTKAARKSEMKRVAAVKKRPDVSSAARAAVDKLPASVKKLIGKKAKIVHGIAGLRKGHLIKIIKIDRYGKTINLHVQHIVHETGGKGRLSKTLKKIPLYSRRDGKNVRRVSVGKQVNSYFDYALRHGLQTIDEVRKAKATKKTKVAKSQTKKRAAAKKSRTSATKTARKRKNMTKAQKALAGSYIKFKSTSGRHKGRYARVDRVMENATGNVDPRDGGVVMDLVVILDEGGVSKQVNEMTSGKRDFTKVTKAGFDKAKAKSLGLKRKRAASPSVSERVTVSETVSTRPSVPASVATATTTATSSSLDDILADLSGI
jgi:hypothetical protein